MEQALTQNFANSSTFPRLWHRERSAPDAAKLASNGLLASLPEESRARLAPDLRLVPLELGKIIYRPGQALRSVYFPLDAIVSKLYLAADGSTVSIGVVGREGIVGLCSFLSGNETTTESMVIKPGLALKLSCRALRREFERGEAFQRMLLLFTQAFMAQTGQIAVCNQYHSVEQQLCGWLLSYLERSASSELRLTHELIARLLGVRREGITRAARRLKQNGLLDYRRGRITVLDRTRMERMACECYHVVNKAYRSLLPAGITEIRVS